MHHFHFRDTFGLIFLAVTNAVAVNKKKLLIFTTEKGEEAFFSSPSRAIFRYLLKKTFYQ